MNREEPRELRAREEGKEGRGSGRGWVRVKGCISVYTQRVCGRNSDKYIEVFQRN